MFSIRFIDGQYEYILNYASIENSPIPSEEIKKETMQIVNIVNNKLKTMKLI